MRSTKLHPWSSSTTPQHYPQGCLGHTLEPPGSPAHSVKTTTLHTRNPLTFCTALTTAPSDPGPELERYLPFTGQELPPRRIPPESSLAQVSFHRCPRQLYPECPLLSWSSIPSHQHLPPSPGPLLPPPESACGGRAWRLCRGSGSRQGWGDIKQPGQLRQSWGREEGPAGPGRAARTWRAGSTPCDGCGRRQRSAACGLRSARPSPAAAPGAPWHNLQEGRWVSRRQAGLQPLPLPHPQGECQPISVLRAAGDTKHSQHLGPRGNGPAGGCLSSSPLHPQCQRLRTLCLRQGPGCPVIQYSPRGCHSRPS